MTGQDFDSWLKEGMDKGWVGPAVCSTHDGIPATDDEMNEFEEGGDPCIHVIRPYRDDEERLAVEAAHSPSVWRKP